MATSDNDEKKLLELYDDGYELFNIISNCNEPTNSGFIQVFFSIILMYLLFS